MRHDRKYVTYKHLSIGQIVHEIKDGKCRRAYEWTVKDINPAYVTLVDRQKKEEKYNPEECLFGVKMSEAEYRSKYCDTAKMIIKNIGKHLQHDDIGYHEMWNSWLYSDIYEMADYCQDNKMMVIGHCHDIVPKTLWLTEDKLDIGVCAEYEDGERIWCHYRSEDVEKFLKKYPELMGGAG